MGQVLSRNASTICALLVILTAYYLIRCHAARQSIWEKQKRGLPVAPGHSFLFGHLLYFKSRYGKFPKDAHYQSVLGDIANEHFQKEGCFYIDMWPVSGIILVVVSPYVAQQIHSNPKISMQRPKLLPRWFKPITGGSNVFDMREQEWKPWRGVFNGAFSAQHVMSLVPGIVGETKTYVDTLRQYAAKKQMFSLDTITLRFMFDVIGRTILNSSLGAQRGYNPLADHMLSQIRWFQPNSEANPFEYLNLARKAVHWWNGRQMDTYIGLELDKRYRENAADPQGKRTKAIIDLVLESRSEDHQSKHRADVLDPDFRTFAIRQIRLFSFVGHDSTSSAICYTMHLLSLNPMVCENLCEEHDLVFGKDVLLAPGLLESKPNLVNDLPYTTAVIKESLRLYPPAGCSRSGHANASLFSDTGKECPTINVEAIFTIHTTMHRSPAYWTRPDDFIPERWLVDSTHPLFPTKGAYRAFEIGPRNCVAQGLVMTELKIVLVMLARQFEFQDSYDEWDSLHPAQKGENRRLNGDRAYQIEEGAAHPAAHYPCRVFLRKQVA